MDNQTTTENKPKLSKDIFETQACSRCGGGGHYSYCQSYGTKCFKCAGQGWQFSKHGKADYERWRAAVDAATVRPVADLKVGQSAKARKDFRRYYPVVSIEGPMQGGWGTVVNGETVWHQVYRITFDREVAIASPVGVIKQAVWDVGVEETVQIHPGADLMPKPEDFVTQPRERRPKAASKEL